jgi:AraC-like DNA-binding protein
MKWITRERPKIDRIACPWLIKRFIDKDAEIIFAEEKQVKTLAKKINAIPFDISGVEHTHYGDECTFDYLIKKYKIKDKAVQTMALIVRGADTDRHDIAAQASGLWAISAGLAFNIKDDHQLLDRGMMIYDALYSWAKHLQDKRHTEGQTEQLLIRVFNKYMKQKTANKRKPPVWTQELKNIIQDQIDTNLAMNLQTISKDLNMHPSYLSRVFSKYFDNLSFGEYIRKLRIEKAIQLLKEPDYTLSEVAYLTGFSDQSHFNRIFKKHTGMQPSVYKKTVLKGKKNSKS